MGNTLGQLGKNGFSNLSRVAIEPGDLDGPWLQAPKPLAFRSSTAAGAAEPSFQRGRLGNSTRQRQINGRLEEGDRYHDYPFRLAKTKAIHLSLKHLQADADLQLLSQTGEVITQSLNSGTHEESLRLTLRPGSYHLRVSPYEGETSYRLKLRTKPFIQPHPLVHSPDETGAQWTVMVYMASHNLEPFALEDFLEMAAIGSSPEVNLVVQLDRSGPEDPGWSLFNPDNKTLGNWKDTRRGLILPGDIPDRTWGTSLGEVNMGDANSLQGFVTWGMTTYPAKNYALVMWGHGTGFNVSYDDQMEDSISAGELKTVLSQVPDTVDLVSADACLMGMTEVAYEIKDLASVFVGSQDLEPGAGYYYTSFLRDLLATPTLTAAQLGMAMVNRYGAYYDQVGYGYETLSAIDLTTLSSSHPHSLGIALDHFARTVMTSPTLGDLTAIASHRQGTANVFGRGTAPDFCDVGILFTAIATDLTISAPIRTAAQTVVDCLRGAILANYSAVPGKSMGLSLYVSAPADNTADALYDLLGLSFQRETQWDEWLNSPGW